MTVLQAKSLNAAALVAYQVEQVEGSGACPNMNRALARYLFNHEFVTCERHASEVRDGLGLTRLSGPERR